jgi:hypothetical protein
MLPIGTIESFGKIEKSVQSVQSNHSAKSKNRKIGTIESFGKIEKSVQSNQSAKSKNRINRKIGMFAN